MISISVSPSTNAGIFTATVADKSICTSRTPMLSAARVLLNQGVPPEMRIEMLHYGSTAWALRSTIGTAAGLTVAEDRATIFRRYKAFPDVAVRPPVRFSEQAATPVALTSSAA